MQDPNEDTEWNDILRSKGILPPKPKEAEITEDQIVSMLEQTIEQKQNKGKELSQLNLDELDELEDSEDEAVLLEYRRKRIAEIKALSEKSKFGSVLEISGQDYVNEVNKAGDGIWVVLHLYKQGLGVGGTKFINSATLSCAVDIVESVSHFKIPLCSLINEYLRALAAKYPTVKFLKAISTTCIPNFPDKNLPTIFIYYEGQMKKQLVGPLDLRGMNLTLDEFEYIIGQTGAIETDIKEDPRPAIRDKLFTDLADANNDW